MNPIAIFKSFDTDGVECFEAHCLDKDGCMSHGITITDAYTNIIDAIKLWDDNIEDLKE